LQQLGLPVVVWFNGLKVRASNRMRRPSII